MCLNLIIVHDDCVCIKFIIVYDVEKPEGHCGVSTHLRSETKFQC
jgi:hypothetical protein